MARSVLGWAAATIAAATVMGANAAVAQSAAQNRSTFAAALDAQEKQEQLEKFLEARRWFREGFANSAQSVIYRHLDSKGAQEWATLRSVDKVHWVSGCSFRLDTLQVKTEEGSTSAASKSSSLVLDFGAITDFFSINTLKQGYGMEMSTLPKRDEVFFIFRNEHSKALVAQYLHTMRDYCRSNR